MLSYQRLAPWFTPVPLRPLVAIHEQLVRVASSSSVS